MSQLILAHSALSNRGISRKTFSSRVNIGVFSLMFILILFIALMSILFLVHYNNMATKGYVLKKLDVERQSLVTEREIKDMHLAEIRSLESIQTRNAVAKMININDVEFVRGDTGIASR